MRHLLLAGAALCVIAATLSASFQANDTPQLCDGVERFYPVNGTAHSAFGVTKAIATSIAFGSFGQPPCADCLDPVGPCLGGTVGVSTEQTTTCARLIPFVYLCTVTVPEGSQCSRNCACE